MDEKYLVPEDFKEKNENNENKAKPNLEGSLGVLPKEKQAEKVVPKKVDERSFMAEAVKKIFPQGR